ncbi:MAG: DUF952 domain-containing protein [Planctomycetes bacterium]|nr:DUF952 domain-containing protein [Planctomycetota bacterium]
MEDRIYKVLSRQLWSDSEKAGVLRGAPIDLKDGFIHFSTASQVVETVAKHFADKDDLLLVEVDAARLGNGLHWELSRGGQLFPHLYSDMALDAVTSVAELPLGPDGTHRFPPNLQSNASGDDN